MDKLKPIISFFVLIAVLFFTSSSIASIDSKDKLSKEQISKLKALSIPFIENKGQVNQDIRFYANTFGGTVFVTKDGEIVYSLPKADGREKDKADERNPKEAFTKSQEAKVEVELKGIALRESLVGSKKKNPIGEERAVTKVNYFKGSDSTKWQKDIKTYQIVNLGEVYEGIEFKLKAYGDNVEKLFYVKPGANADVIKVKMEGAKALSINDNGELEADTELGKVRFTKPIAYQMIDGKRVDIEARYILPEVESLQGEIEQDIKTYAFYVGEYDKTKELIIDPLLASTFIGGFSDDYARALALDSSGNVYVAGYTMSSSYPTTEGTYDISFNRGGYDVFVSKLNSDLTSLLASTFIGGSSGDFATALAVDNLGNVYVAGYTNSSDYPITTGAYDTSFDGYYSSDVFVSKLSSDLTSLLASTFIGGSYGDVATTLAFDSSGNIYVAGYTNSTDYPTTSVPMIQVIMVIMMYLSQS